MRDVEDPNGGCYTQLGGSMMNPYDALPGGDWILRGLEDLSRGLQTVPSLLVSIGAPRLQAGGIPVSHPLDSPELRLYELLSHQDPDSAHSRYNALIRRLVSFERAAGCAS